ncbi:MAG: hypothetical protein IPM37_15665 [Hahellaceae bacterium]|nr:hypothetical protein [Hahellaceae bacterium]
MRQHYPVLHVARICFEAKTPLALHSGRAGDGFDSELVRDANGLPTISGTAIGGVLRHLWFKAHGESTSALFGDAGIGTDEQASRVRVSWACVHDSKDRPVTGLATSQDPVLDWLSEAQPLLRDNVRLNHRGSAQDGAKFDRVVVPRGTRFTTELRLLSASLDDRDWPMLRALFVHPGFRLGASTRAGLGAVSVIRTTSASFDLRDETQFRAFSQMPVDLRQPAPVLKACTDEPDVDACAATVKLRPVTPWRIGASNGPVLSLQSPDKPADGRLMVEGFIDWNKGSGEVKRHGTAQLLVIPGSSVKGALSHRILFHYLRLTGRFAEDALELYDTDAGGGEKSKGLMRPAAIRQLLGDVENSKQKSHSEQSRAGVLTVDDCFLTIQQERIEHRMHNSIDRFTGGTRDTALFSDELVNGGEFTLQIYLDQDRMKGIEAAARQALQLALDDLAEGRLPLGGGVSKGQGVFSGKVDWTETGRAWLQEGPIQVLQGKTQGAVI